MSSATYMRPLPSNRITAELMTCGSATTSSMRYPGGRTKVLPSSSGIRGLTGGFGEKSAPALVVDDSVPPVGGGAAGVWPAGAAGGFCSATGPADKERVSIVRSATPANSCNRFHMSRLVTRGLELGQGSSATASATPSLREQMSSERRLSRRSPKGEGGPHFHDFLSSRSRLESPPPRSLRSGCGELSLRCSLARAFLFPRSRRRRHERNPESSAPLV